MRLLLLLAAIVLFCEGKGRRKSVQAYVLGDEGKVTGEMAEVLALHNEIRRSKGLKDLVYSQPLAE